jgi:hypothetical protein
LPSLNWDRRWLVVAVLATALAGCSYITPGQVPEPPKLEPSLFPARYKAQIAEFMRTSLSNPTKVKDAYIAEPVLKPIDKVPQYFTCVRYNPRDTKNQYEGVQTNLAIFLGGMLVQFLPERPELCNGLTYLRYPEIESMVP